MWMCDEINTLIRWASWDTASEEFLRLGPGTQEAITARKEEALKELKGMGYTVKWNPFRIIKEDPFHAIK